MDEPNFPVRRRMEPFDTLMYRGESDPRARSTLIGVFILDRAPEWDRLLEVTERMTRAILPMRQKVVEPTLPVTLPVWVVDPDFDLSYHVRRTRLPAPGTQQQLLEFLEPMTMTPLDPARPLWEYTLIEGLEDDRAAWVTKISHVLSDGVGGQALASLIFDLERDAPAREMPPLPTPVDLTANELMRDTIVGAPLAAATTAVRGARAAASAGLGLVRRPGRTVGAARAYAQSLRRVMAGPPVEPSPILRRRSLRRRLLVMEFGIDDIKAASKSGGGSLNDGFLAAVCGAVRLYHEKLGVPIESMSVAVPINLRADDDPAGGNRWAGARLALPVGEQDPAERIQRIRQSMLDARQEPAINAFNLIAPIAVRMPQSMLALAFNSSGGAADLQVSNIPGSPVTLYFAGAKVLKLFPFGPLPGPAAMITLNSYGRDCYVGVNLDPAAITEPELFGECLQAGLDEVLGLR